MNPWDCYRDRGHAFYPLLPIFFSRSFWCWLPHELLEYSPWDQIVKEIQLISRYASHGASQSVTMEKNKQLSPGVSVPGSYCPDPELKMKTKMNPDPTFNRVGANKNGYESQNIVHIFK